MHRRTFLASAVGVIGSGRFGAASGAVDSSPGSHPVRVVTGLRATFQSLGWIGTQAGVFKRLGLDVTFPKLETGGPEAAAGLVRGDWEFAETGSSPLIQGVLDGRDTVILLTPTAPSVRRSQILARPGITEPKQLEGKRIGVLTETGQTTIQVRVALRKWSVSATLVPLGTFARVYASIVKGEVDAGALPFDYRFIGPRQSKLNIIETPDTGFSTAAVGCTRKFIAENREVVGRLVQGYVEAIHFFKTRRNEVVPLLQQFLEFNDRSAVEEAYDHYAPLFQPLPRPSANGIRELLAEIARTTPAAANVSVESVTDLSFLDELQRRGFVDELYGKRRDR
jgi:ABC-type nitrate/sulfonate/bicarbonate transport system substrate-binding protein